MNHMKFETPDIVAGNIEKIGALFPSAITEMRDENGNVKKGINFEVLKQLLSRDVVDGDECYEFTWVGKKAAMAEAARPTTKTLRPVKEDSRDWDTTENLYIEGDNLEVLKILQESYLGKVRMIFIDPPYNTGSDSFVYEDNFKMDDSEYEKDIEYRDEAGKIQFVQNNSANPKFHSNWLKIMCERLLLARNLLSDNGSIFISIDHNEHATLKLLCDEVFGAKCFIGDLVWKSSDNSNNNALTFSEDHNYILVYAKNPDWKPNFLNDPKKRAHFKNPDNDPKGPWFDGNPVNNPGLRVNLQYDITTPNGKIIHHPANGWRWSWETVQEKLKTGELRFSEDETRLIRRTYLCDMEGLPPSTLCVNLDETGHTRGAKYELKKLFPEIPVTNLFSTPKPTLLLKYLMKIGSSNNSLVLDFFSGSSSTADALMQLNQEDWGNRKFIMVQVQEPCEQDKAGNPIVFENICEFGKERIRRAGDKIKEEHPLETKDLDTGFRVFRVDSSNMKDVYYHPDELDQTTLMDMVSNIKDDRTDMDLLYACLLDWGVEINLPHTSTELDGCTIHNVDNGALIACFDANIPASVIEYMAKQKPLRAVFRDSAFTADDAKINVTETFKNFSPDTSVKVI